MIPGVQLLPVGPREGIIVNAGDMRLYYFVKDEPPRSYPIGIAKEGYATPQRATKIVRKKENPIWYPSSSAPTGAAHAR